MSATIAVIVLVCVVFFCILISAAMERRGAESREHISPALLRVRLDIFQRRIRQLEEDQAQLAREIEGRQARQEHFAHLREMERENDLMLLEQLQHVQRMRRELQQIQPEEVDDNEDDASVAKIKRKAVIEWNLYFQELSFEESALEKSKSTTSDVENTCLHRHHSTKFNSMPKSECSICLDNYKPGETIAWSRCATCPHYFHSTCISSWLEQNDACPLCRVNIIREENSDASISV